MKTFEEWRVIPSLNGKYSASSHGNIKSNNRRVKDTLGRNQTKFGVVLLPRKNRGGYLYVTVTPEGRPRKTRTVHSLVGEAFGIKVNGLVCNHKDGNKTNNRIENLEWVTCKENIVHSWNTGMSKPTTGGRNGSSKMDGDKVRKIRELYRSGLTQKTIGDMFGMSQTGIGKIVRGELWN